MNFLALPYILMKLYSHFLLPVFVKRFYSIYQHFVLHIFSQIFFNFHINSAASAEVNINENNNVCTLVLTQCLNNISVVVVLFFLEAFYYRGCKIFDSYFRTVCFKHSFFFTLVIHFCLLKKLSYILVGVKYL